MFSTEHFQRLVANSEASGGQLPNERRHKHSVKKGKFM